MENQQEFTHYHSQEIGLIAAALSIFQSKVETIPKDKQVEVAMKSGGKYRYSYAPYDSIVEKVKVLLGENKLAYTQIVSGSSLITMLIHESGQWFKTIMPLTAHEGNPQAYGSDITYKRRYSLGAILGIATEGDDDGGMSQQAAKENKSAKLKEPRLPELTPDSEGWNNAVKACMAKGIGYIQSKAYLTDENKKKLIAKSEAEKAKQQAAQDPF